MCNPEAKDIYYVAAIPFLSSQIVSFPLFFAYVLLVVMYSTYLANVFYLSALILPYKSSLLNYALLFHLSVYTKGLILTLIFAKWVLHVSSVAHRVAHPSS